MAYSPAVGWFVTVNVGNYTARSRRLPATATPLVSECGKCSVNIGISVSLPVYVVAADPFFGISETVSCVLQYKTVAANLKILCSHGDVVQIPCK